METPLWGTANQGYLQEIQIIYTCGRKAERCEAVSWKVSPSRRVTVLKAECQKLLCRSTHTAMRYGLLQDGCQTREQHIALLYEAGPYRPQQSSISCKERRAGTTLFIHPEEM